MTLPLSTHAPPKEPYGYRCNKCGSVWDADYAPRGTPEEIEAAMTAWKAARCPACNALGPSLANPRLYARLKAERKVRELGAGTA